jgi:hypothetical protein
MTSSRESEHFCTLFDSNYLPLGMALHQSLVDHALPFHLWILCMDELVEHQLQKLNLPDVTLIRLGDIETSALLSVKSERSCGEYCWTLTPFIFQAVFDRDSNVAQVTYLDADLFFLDDPRILLEELPSDKGVLITEHAYAPEYEQSDIHGRFCVQFLTVKRTEAALAVIQWWQDRCIEWCFNRREDGKFGDQMYLDVWPDLFANEVYIVQHTEKTLAPWNVQYFWEKLQSNLKPVFFHFHGLRIVAPDQVQLYLKYRIGKYGKKIYEDYTAVMREKVDNLKVHGISIPYFPLSYKPYDLASRIKRIIFKEIKFKKIV